MPTRRRESIVTTKAWFITGASSGFGNELTTQVLARGDRVAATGLHPERFAELSERYGEQLWTAALDVTDTPAPGGSRSAATPTRRSPPRGVTGSPHSNASVTSPTART
ncbi:MAG: short-chain dehydrogenase/reductase, partial [Actinobacteria bacterium]|nr:short-chain dehydrogenase/reductase [Actinomycetota bacterium]